MLNASWQCNLALVISWVWDVVDLLGLLPKVLAAQVRKFKEVGSGYQPWLGGSLFLGVN